MAPVRAPVDHIVAFTMMESRVHDKASFNRFPNFRFYAGIYATYRFSKGLIELLIEL